MDYPAWRISFQSSEQAAQAAFNELLIVKGLLAETRAEAERSRKLLDEAQENLERDVAAMPMFPITAQNAEAAQDAMTGVCFTLGVLRVRELDFVRAGEQGANGNSTTPMSHNSKQRTR